MRKPVLALILTFVFGGLIEAGAQTSRPVTIRVNQQKTIIKNKLTIGFVSLMEDSRCPVDVNCVWAGNARIQIKVGRSKNAMKTFELNTGLKPKIISFAGYEIKLISLDPKPRTNARIDRNAYTATLAVSKPGK